MSDYLPVMPLITEDPWVGVPSHQVRRHWEVTRRLVLEVATDDVRDILRRVQKSRRAAGWRPCRVMELDAALQDVRGLLYLLVEVGVPTPMKLWALTRAAGGIWATPSQNFYKGVSTTDVALRIRGWENDRAYNEAVPDIRRITESECCWLEGRQPLEFYDETEQLCDEVVENFCTTKIKI
jgi:hypothetical protein